MVKPFNGKNWLTLPALDRASHVGQRRDLRAFDLVKAAFEAKTHGK